MQRHDLDPVSLFSGIALLLVAGGYALTHSTDARLHWLVAVPALLVLVGVAVIVSVVRRLRTAADVDPVCDAPAADVQ